MTQATLGIAAASILSPFKPAEAGQRGSSKVKDVDVLNFALNLEYLEAEFYNRAVNGVGLSAADIEGTGTQWTIAGGTAVPFKTPAIAQYAAEIAADELAHVRFLRNALGSNAIAEPTINLVNSFTTAAIAAGSPAYPHRRPTPCCSRPHLSCLARSHRCCCRGVNSAPVPGSYHPLPST